MPGIYVMAVITIAASALLWGGILMAMSGQGKRYLWLLIPAMPLSAVVNLLVKTPLAFGAGWLFKLPPNTGSAPPAFMAFLFLLAPVCEEAIKLLPFVGCRIRAFLDHPVNALWAGMALGIGFGLGEAAYLAWGIAQSPEYSSLPWYLFTGYAGERMMVCLAHGAMTAVAAGGLQRGGWHGLLGYLTSVALHALLNVGAALYQFGVISVVAAQLPTVVAIIGLVLLFERRLHAAMASPGAPDAAKEIVYFRRESEQTNEPIAASANHRP